MKKVKLFSIIVLTFITPLSFGLGNKVKPEQVSTDKLFDYEQITPKIDEMVAEGLVTLENVEVVRYAPKKKE